ncbi:hypothetical protein [Ktedonobacter racemifer]|uniref:Uncharacterized protein n=1 Tax=Ktedonobacter racemifer DSM 44963 TaxID=485913 RepID=D6U259_KTERA|nr:hypothetical protein [Ktedonobacter racemifer]EFH82727.1 hypothetical protein Krac_3570 [Ktedonobacter racemifer DSM 44963]
MDTNNTQKLAIAGATTLVAEPVFLMAHYGGVGVIAGLAAGAFAYWLADEFSPSAEGEETSPTAAAEKGSPTKKDKAPGESSLLYRMLNGKSMRSEGQDEQQNNEPEAADTQRQEGPWVPPQFRLDDVLAVVRDFNQQNKLYFGDTEEGAASLKLSKVYHIMDVASSGNGKSNRFRLIMMQTVTCCETYYINPLAANVKLVDDERKIEVWKPIFDRLANGHPVKEGPEIHELMTSLVAEINTRNEQEQEGDFSWRERPILAFIDELPEVAARCPEAIELLDKIGRTGRQFFVFCCVASQTALVSEIGQSTAAQANYKTRIYGGGDKTSAGRMMKGKVPADVEKTLATSKAGLSLMLAEGMQGGTYVRAPLVTNEALFAYLGLPAFRMEDWIKSKPSVQPTRRMVPMTDPAFPTLTLLRKNENKAEMSSGSPRESVKSESRESVKRVKGPNEEAILEAMDALADEGQPLTINAIAKKAGLTWRKADDIEDVASYYGFDLERGSGRPTKEAAR